MSYNITIGNAKPDFHKEDGLLYARWIVEAASSDDAPTFPHDKMTGNGNCRSPGYSAWRDFCRSVGIYAMWYGEDEGLLREHPGCFPLEQHHHATVKDALDRWKAKATLPPGFQGWNGEDQGKYDAGLARLMWMEWWMAWALKNCETPAVQNT